MRTRNLFATACLVMLCVACGGNGATDCDPLMGEFRDLMADYEKGLEEMVAAKEVDELRMAGWNARAEALGDRIAAKGEQGLGARCWKEFNDEAAERGGRIMALSLELARIAMEQEGIDPQLMERYTKALEE